MIKDHMVTGVPGHAVDKVWDDVKHLLELVDMRGRLSTDDLYSLTKACGMQLWIIEPLGSGKPVAAALTEVVNYPSMRVVRVVALGGKDMALWIETLNGELDRFAKLVHASVIEANVREGLARRLRATEYGGYERTSVVVQRLVPAKTENQKTEALNGQ